MDTIEFLYDGEPLLINKEVMRALSWNAEKTHLEFMIYVYALAHGTKQTVFGKEYTALEFDVCNLMKYFGYAKSKIYQTIQNLIDFDIITRMSISSRLGNRTFLMITDTVNLDKVMERFPRRGVIPSQWNESATVERFRPGGMIPPRWNDSMAKTNLEVVDNKQLMDAEEVPVSEADGVLYKVKYSLNTRELRSSTGVQNTTGIHNATGVHNTRELRSSTGIHNATGIHDTRSIIIPRAKQEACQKSPDGHYASEYTSGGSRAGQVPKSDQSAIVRYFMQRVYSMHRIDYYIPKSNLKKYYIGANRVLTHLGGLETAKRYIEWFLRKDSFKSSGYGLDLLMSAPVLNQFLAASPKDTRQGMSTKFVEAEDREEYFKKNKGRII